MTEFAEPVSRYKQRQIRKCLRTFTGGGRVGEIAKACYFREKNLT
jgi:hypothetical protein